jgi:alpha-L-fucosidase
LYDDNWKSAETIIRNLIDIASKGGNYLLNVGPTADGLIPQPSVERLADVGKWMRVNGQAIYGTTASPFATQLPFGRATSKPGRVNVHVFDWPADGRLRVPSWGKRVKRVYLLTTPKPDLKFVETAEAIEVEVPTTAPDKVATVIVMDLDKRR